MKVYIDVLFLVNFVMNFIILKITAIFFKIEKRHISMAVGAALGAIYCVGALFLPDSFLFGTLFKAFVGALMVFIAFMPSSIRRFMCSLAAFFTVSFTMAGMGFFLFCFTDFKSLTGAIFKNSAIYADINIYLLVTLAALTYGVISLAVYFIKKVRIKDALIYKIVISYKGREIELNALYDSGNFLKETLSQKSVMVAQWDSVKTMFDDAESIFNAQSRGALFIPIPYRGLEKNNIMFAFLPDEIFVIKGKEKKNLPVAYVGLIEKKLDKNGRFSVILPNDFMEGYEENVSSAEKYSFYDNSFNQTSKSSL